MSDSDTSVPVIVKDVKKFTYRDLGMIYDKIVEKIVTDICESLVDGKSFTQNLRDILVEKMSKILDRSDTESKMNAVIIQGMNTSLRRATNGPLLLYALLKQSPHDNTAVEILKIFKSVHEDSQSVYQFRKKLMTELQTPPYKEWFPSTPSTTTGGGKSKRKTRKKSTRKKRKLKNKTRRGGGFVDSIRSAASNAKSGIAAAGSGLKNKMGETGSGMMAKAREMKSAAGNARRAAVSGIRNAPGAVGNAMYNAPGAARGAVSDAWNAATGQQEVELSETGLEQNSNELYEKYHKKIIEMITKKMDDTAGDITKKMTNVSYVYMMEHGKEILESTLNTLEKVIESNQSIQNVFPILVVQALYQARNDVGSAIMSAEKERLGDKKSDTFEKPDDAFVAFFIKKLMDKLAIKVGDVDPDIK